MAPASGAVTARDWGIEEGYEDALGAWCPTPDETRAALVAAMRADGSEPEAAGGVLVLRQGRRLGVDGPAEVRLEDGTVLAVKHSLPADLPLGYHELRWPDGSHADTLIVTPGRCHLPAGLKAWGLAVQLYALRSAGSWGIGDLGDLRALCEWASADLGARVIVINPLHATTPVLPQEPSPYRPSSRRYLNPLCLRVEDAPGAAEARLDLDGLAAAGRALSGERRIDRDAVFRLKMEALARLWQRFAGDPGFDRYRAEQGQELTEFATFCALAEQHGAGWRRWPAEHRRPEAPAVARFAADRAERIGFHAWLQWLLDGQLARAAASLRLIQDLPVGFDPEGADAWAWQDLLALDATVGAPPDEYNTRGQDWGLPPFVPHRLRAAAYRPVVQTLRAMLRHAGGLRIDHVMGLFRLFWIPRGASPAAGTYVRYPAEELLGIIALESQRARALVVGEDLGTVDRKARARLVARGVLSYRLLWFEAHPRRYPARSLAAVTTHDLPTVAGLWSGADLRAQRTLGLEPNERGWQRIRGALAAAGGLGPAARSPDAVVAAYRLLARAPSAIVTATLEDMLGVEERPNMPAATGAQWPNWCLALPAPLEDIQRAAAAQEVAQVLRARQGARMP